MGKNQKALLKFLQKYPEKWHSLHGYPATFAAVKLEIRNLIQINTYGQVKLK